MIVIRCDSSYEIGTGHVTRCLSLAENLASLDLSVHFVCRELPGNIASKISSAGYKLTLLPSAGSAEDEIQTISSLHPSWLVVDHYGLDQKWESQWRDVCPVFVIDDLDRQHQCQALLDQNFHADSDSRYQGKVPSDCWKFIGPQFCLLSRKLLAETRRPSHGRKKILCFFGGSDPSGESLRLATTLTQVSTGAFFQIVVGSQNRDLNQIQTLKGDHFEILVSPPNWYSLMAQADLYFGSGGTVTWERLFLGLPGVVIAVAENQEKIAQALADARLQIYWGRGGEKPFSQAIVELDSLVLESDRLREMSDRGMAQVRPFPNEVLRSVFAESQELRLRQARLSDSTFLLNLRNDPLTREMSRSTHQVSSSDHEAWFKKTLAEASTRLYVAEIKHQPCGQFRVSSSRETSVSVAPDFRGQGLAKEIIKKGVSLYLAEFPETAELTAEIKLENEQSRKSFEHAGFKSDGQKNLDGQAYLLFKYSNFIGVPRFKS